MIRPPSPLCLLFGMGLVRHRRPSSDRITGSPFLSEMGDEDDLMRIAGWSSRAMVMRYGASAGTERAIEAHRKHSPADRL